MMKLLANSKMHQQGGSVVCLIVLIAARSCFAIPGYWLDPSKNIKGTTPASAPGCLDHPTAAYGVHGAPKDDK
jgi:hypothetical protein